VKKSHKCSLLFTRRSRRLPDCHPAALPVGDETVVSLVRTLSSAAAGALSWRSKLAHPLAWHPPIHTCSYWGVTVALINFSEHAYEHFE